jgi:hypothetical protein
MRLVSPRSRGRRCLRGAAARRRTKGRIFASHALALQRLLCRGGERRWSLSPAPRRTPAGWGCPGQNLRARMSIRPVGGLSRSSRGSRSRTNGASSNLPGRLPGPDGYMVNPRRRLEADSLRTRFCYPTEPRLGRRGPLRDECRQAPARSAGPAAGTVRRRLRARALPPRHRARQAEGRAATTRYAPPLRSCTRKR